MSYVKKYQLGVQKLSDDLESIKKNIIAGAQNDIINYYQMNQVGLGLKKGTRKSSIVIGWYTKNTEEASRDPHRRPRNGIIKFQYDRYNMEWTGKFFDKMYIWYQDKYSFNIGSSVSYAGDIIKQNGDIFSLTDTTMDYVLEKWFNPRFEKQLNKRLSDILSL
jgi:hypothetical protein